MGETMLTWNFTNWVTVLLMVAVGFAIFHFAASGVRTMRRNGAGPNGMSNAPSVK